MVLDQLKSRLLGRKSGRVPTKVDSFKQLHELGVPVETVLDVGVQKCTGELIMGYPDAFHLLMEPITDFEQDIHRNYGANNIRYEYAPVAVSNKVGEAVMQLSSVREGMEITHARLVEQEKDGVAHRATPVTTLDTLVGERDLKRPFLLKIDVDGAELDVLAGAEETLKDCTVICIEAGIKTFLERALFITRAGFQPFDIVDLCYYDGRLVQTDMIFLSEKIIRDKNLEVYRNGFDIEKWQAYI